MKSKTLAHILLAAAALAPTAVAASDGTAAYSWLNITSSSKIYGLGGMNISLVDDDIASADQNPALLGPEMHDQLLVNYMHYLGGSNFAGFTYGRESGPEAAWSAGVQYFGYGSIKEALPDGTVTGTFAPSDIAFRGAYSRTVTGNLRGGIGLKLLYSSYGEYNALALATDLGLNYYDPDTDLSLSAVAANLGGQIKRFDTAHQPLPFDLRLGWSKTFGDFPVRFSVTAHDLTRWHMPYTDYGDGSAAAVTQLKESFTSNLFRHLVLGADLISSPAYYLGAGYNYKTRTDMSTYTRSLISGWSLAGGLKGRGFGVGAALAQPHTGGFTFMLNLNLSLNELLR